MQYCSGCKKASVKFTINNQAEEIISTNPPLSVVCSSNDYIDVSVSMTAPINLSFNRPIASIQNIGGSWTPGGSNNVTLACPTTSTIPVQTVYPDCSASPLQISGNSLIGNFDCNYADNVGSCSYRIFFGDVNFSVSDNSGTIYQKMLSQCPLYTVSCNDDCPNGYCKIDCEQYPGYCCLNEAEIQSLSNQLR